MSTLEAFILGVIQGLTEFLPISSSGHLALGQRLLGLSDLGRYLFFDLICHVGTLLAILVTFRSKWKGWHSLTRMGQLLMGTLPLFPLVLVLKPIKAIYSDPHYLGTFFLVTAAMLFFGLRRSQIASTRLKRWYDPLLIGMSQAAAVLPGVSRSGATIATAYSLGWQPQEAITFSFLLAIPAILGGTILQLGEWIFKGGENDVPLTAYLTALITSFGVGLFSLRLLILLATKEKLGYFVWYCTLLGILLLVY